MEKRTWVYVLQPAEFGMSGCECGNTSPEWSEYKNHLWCKHCNLDFIPKDSGLFDGPIGINICKMMGITFDRFNLETQQLEPFNLETRDWVSK